MLRERTEEIFGDGIFASDPPQWKMHRKIGSRAFSMRNLKNYMFEVAMRGDIRFMNKIEQLRTTTHSIDIYDLFAIYTLDVFVEIAFGQSLQIIEAIPKPHPFSKAFDKSLQLIVWRFRNPFFRTFKYFQIGYEKELSKCLKEVDKFANDMLKSISDNMDKGSLRDTSGGQQLNMLSLFLKHNPNLTRKDLRDIAMNFIIAGRDTTRSLLAWFLYELSLKKNEEIEKKIMLEINNFYENEKELTYENIQNHYENNSEKISYFKYLEACILETLRLYPPAPLLLRFAVRDVQLPGPEGYIVEKGEGVTVNSYVQGRNTDVWGKDAAMFKPERFIEKGLNSYEPHVFPVFNIAPRMCLGRHVALMEAKLVVIRFLKTYRFEPIKNQQIKKATTFVLNMENGFKIKVFPREQELNANP